MESSHDAPYARVATPDEISEAAWVLARAFAHDPAMNWFGHVKEMLPEQVNDYKALPSKAKSVLRKLYAFEYSLMRATIMSGGVVTVAVVPSTVQEAAQPRDRVSKNETIAGVTIWLQPGQPMDFRLWTMLRSGLSKVPFSWGLTGVKVRP